MAFLVHAEASTDSPMNRQWLPCQGWTWRRKRVHAINIGKFNIGSMTGRSRKVADVTERRKLDFLDVQETKQRILAVIESCYIVELVNDEDKG